jgi:two-component system, cell cycle sensor histidine kinase and response regulator CckA
LDFARDRNVKPAITVPGDLKFAPKETASKQKHADTVLLVDDEPIVRKVMGRRLRQAGFSVIEAANGQEAIAAANQPQNEIDMVVSDVVMPEMNGPEVVAEIQRSRPSVAVLYVSGYPEDVIARRGVLQPGIEFMEKPLVSGAIASKAREVLNRKRSNRF